MAVTGKGKQIAKKTPAASSRSSTKRKIKAAPEAESSAAARRKRRRSGALQFFDDAAAESDFEDEDLKMDDDDLDFDSMDHAKPEINDLKEAGKTRHLPFFLKEEELSGDELEELIKDRYRQDPEHDVLDGDSEEGDEDPTKVSIWKVKCMVGRERHIAFCLMQKYIDLEDLGNKLPIISAFSLDHIKGYVYIEADKERDVVEACKGLCILYSSRMVLVPKNEFPNLLSARNKTCEVSKDTWVRVKSGKYKGDLAKVVDIDEGRKRATIKLIPRIDLQALAKKFGGGVSLKHSAVPAPHLISSRELEEFRPHIESRRDRQTGELFDLLDGSMLKDGFLYKKMAFASLVLWGVQPTDAELSNFTERDMNEPEDMSWVSTVYGGRKKTQSGKVSDDKMADEEGNGYDLYDLILFGKKNFGVIIANKCGSFQVLKGGVGEPETVTITSKEIKKGCVDKMFTSTDRHLKTILINDIVKVLEGPHEGKQGTVRHMYRGTLFIYDKNLEENCGFFCAKSDLSENLKESKNSSTRDKSFPSFTQSPTRSSEEQDTTRQFTQNRPSDKEQTFSVGQRLRIRKGPLKGYLCRVMRIYRSDVTVKLDSMGKVITVHESLLSAPTLGRDDSAAISSNPSGMQEWQSIGGLFDEERGNTVDKNSWDVAMPSSGRDPWAANAGDNGNKLDNEEGADPWGSNAASGTRDQEQKDDPWGTKATTGDQEQKDDPWGTKATTGAQEQATDPWGSNTITRTGDQEQKDDTWDSKAITSAGDQEQKDDPWGNKATTDGTDKGQGNDSWGGNTSFGAKKDPFLNKGTDIGAKSASSGSQNSTWNIPRDAEITGSSKGWSSEKDADGWNKAAPASADAGDQKQKNDTWGIKPMNSAGDREQKNDPWDSKATTEGTNKGQGNDSWVNTSFGAKRDPFPNKGTDSWGKPSTSSANQSSTWNMPRDAEITGSVKGWSSEKDAGGWNKAVPGNGGDKKDDAWDLKGKGKVSDDGDGWGKAAPSKENADTNAWGKSDDTWDIKESKISNDGDGWGKAAASIKNNAEANVWGISSNPSSQNSGNKSAPAGGWETPSAARWNKEGNNDDRGNQTDTWNKPNNFEGGRGRGRGRGWGRGNDGNGDDGDREKSWNQKSDFDGGRGSSWGRGRFGGRGRDGNGNNEGGDVENTWNQQRDFDGGRGRGRFGGRGRDGGNDYGGGNGENTWGRGGGRGRFGGRGNRDHDDGDSGGGWGSGRGRGRNGDSWGQKNDSDEGGSFGRGRGRFQSSDWKNDEENSKNSSFSKNTQSSWGNDQTGGWQNSKDFGSGQSSNWNKNDGNDTWGSQKAIDGNQPSSWNQAKDTAANQSSGWDNVKGDNWNTPKGTGGDAWSAGKEAGGLAGSGWESAKPENKQPSSWNVNKPGGNEIDKVGSSSWNKDNEKSGEPSGWNNGGNSDWSKPKPSAGNQSSGWNNSGNNDWNKPKSGGWNNEGTGDQTEGWNRGSRNFNGGDQQSGWRGNSFRGRGRGRSFGGQDDGNEADTFNGRKPFGRDESQGEFRGRGRRGGGNWGGRSGGWNAGGNDDKGDQAGGWAKTNQGGGSGGGGEDWSRPKGGNGGRGSGWNAGEETGWKAGGGAPAGGWNAGGNADKGDQAGGWAKTNQGGGSGGDDWSQPKGGNVGSRSGWNAGEGTGWKAGGAAPTGGWSAGANADKGEGSGSWAKKNTEGGSGGAGDGWSDSKGSGVDNGSGWNTGSGGSGVPAASKVAGWGPGGGGNETSGAATAAGSGWGGSSSKAEQGSGSGLGKGTDDDGARGRSKDGGSGGKGGW